MTQFTIPLFLQSLLSNPSSLLNATTILRDKIINQSSFLNQYAQWLISGQEQVLLKPQQYFQSITLIHPVLVQIFPQLSQEHQDQIRSALLSSVAALHKNIKVVAALALLTRQISDQDGIEPWIQPLGQLIQWATSEQKSIITAANIHRLAPKLLQKLFEIFAQPELQQEGKQKLLYLVLQVIKCFSPLDGVDDSVVKQCFDGTFQLWMSIFVSAIQGSLNNNLTIKRYILKILIVIFRDMQRYLTVKKYHRPNQIYILWEFVYRLIPLYNWNIVWNKSLKSYPPQPRTHQYKYTQLYYDQDIDAELSVIQALSLNALQFLSVLISVPILQGVVRLSTHHIVNAIFHYLLLPKEQLVGWKNIPQYFLASNNNLEYQMGMRGKCLALLNDLIQKLGDLAIQAILIACEKFLLNLPQQNSLNTFTQIQKTLLKNQSLQQITAGIFQSQSQIISLSKISGVDIRSQLNLSGQTWHKMQAGLLVLGRFSQDIIVFQSKQGDAFDIEGFIKGMIKQIKQQDYYQLLKGQSLYCLTRFTQIISIKFRQLFPQLVIAALSANKHYSPLSLRVIACKSAAIFLKKMQKHKIEPSSQLLFTFNQLQIVDRVCQLPFSSQTLPIILDILNQMHKYKQILGQNTPPSEYYLTLFQQSLYQQSNLNSFINLLQNALQIQTKFKSLSQVFIKFMLQCLTAYNNTLRSQQKQLLKSADIQLISTAVRITNVFVNYCQKQQYHNHKIEVIDLLSVLVQLLEVNLDVQLQIGLSVLIKSIIKMSQNKAVRQLLTIPSDKSLQSGSIYAGNLAILFFQRILNKNHNQILQQIVLKVFKSRTPSVIQSLILVYARLINRGVTQENKFQFTKQNETQVKQVVDFLSSFSIQNRMGLKILIDKWLLQQSLFRGKYTKIATFMALSRLFLLNDKRIDNLLVIGFNPSHTNVNNDVNAPLKILATLIRSLDNQVRDKNQQSDDDQRQEIQQKQQGINVQLEKFRQQQKTQDRVGGLADRQNQQGSTCYMSAMLQFYDDGEQCDDKTQEDLIFLKDSSTNFNLGEYLTQFFKYLSTNRSQYLKQCMKGLLKQDIKTIKKYISS